MSEKEELIELKILQAELKNVVDRAKKEKSLIFNKFRLYTPYEVEKRVEFFKKQYTKTIIDGLFDDSALSPMLYKHELDMYPTKYSEKSTLYIEMDCINELMKPVFLWANTQNQIYTDLEKTVIKINELEETLDIPNDQKLKPNLWYSSCIKNGAGLTEIVKVCDKYLNKNEEIKEEKSQKSLNI